MEINKTRTEPIDPLRRVFAYNGNRFVTTDGIAYRRTIGIDTIRRTIPKVRGKKARAADKLARRKGQ